MQRTCIGLVLLFIGLIRCSGGPIAGTPGTGQETTNGIVATALLSDGRPAAGAVVRLRRADYLTRGPGASKSAMSGADALTDASGRFEFRDVVSGEYRIEINNGTSAALLTCTLGVGDIANLGTAYLRAHAAIAGEFASGSGRAYVQIYGLERLTITDSAGRFHFPDIPAGSFRLRIVDLKTALAIHVDEVRTEPGESTIIKADPRWLHSKRVYLNTTVTGAHVAEDVIGFALLVRFSTQNFDFTSARDSGQDLRFAKSNGSPLSYEIERWDPVLGKADVWVRVDTVYGNNDRQFIMMTWGNPEAASQSNAAAVFDTGDGYAGVWHLSQSPNAGADAILDRTPLRHHATAYGAMGPESMSEGMTGLCLKFDGMDDYVSTRDAHSIALGSGPVSICGWFKFGVGDNAVMSVRGVDGKEARRLRLRILDGRLRFGMHDYTAANDTLMWVENRSDNAQPIDSSWHSVTVVFERGSRAIAYLDGSAVDTVDISPLSVTLDSAVVCMGYDAFASESFASGMIDEVRISRKALTPSAIKLGYENQSRNNTLTP